MPDIKTEITEIATGLGVTGIESLPDALAARPAMLLNVSPMQWDRLDSAFGAGDHATLFADAFASGRAFFTSPDALRKRVPQVIEWKGGHQPPGFDLIPADLRIDHVFLVSCKYQSKILSNSSPSNLFDRRLADRTIGAGTDPWYALHASDEYEVFYSCVREYIGADLLPSKTADLSAAHIAIIREQCTRVWPAALKEPWSVFSYAIASGSAQRWNAQLTNKQRKEEMLWRLLRLSPAPYFLLGSSDYGPLRVRIGTPWDWRQSFKISDLIISPAAGGQPLVNWSGRLTDKTTGLARQVDGHVEVRWAHGRFSSVEAKIYLDTPHHEVPGYFPLAP